MDMVNRIEDKNLNLVMKEKIDESIEKKARGKLPTKAIPMIEEALLKVEGKDVPLKEALRLTPDMINEIYQYGFHLYQSGKFKEALPVFNLLRVLSNQDPRFTFSIAACHHQLKNYEEAAGNYMLYELLDATNPLPYFHMYDCFTKLGQPDLALNALHQASRLMDQKPQYAELKGKVDLELAHLKSREGDDKQKQKSSTA
jgi:type III secretion system low calcium response chaperone LcrH/SycD